MPEANELLCCAASGVFSWAWLQSQMHSANAEQYLDEPDNSNQDDNNPCHLTERSREWQDADDIKQQPNDKADDKNSNQ